MSSKKARLGADDWINAGLQALATDGPDALKAELLARRLGTTKGSFYWHFKDVPDFQRQVMGQWEHQTLNLLSDTLTKVSDPVQRLQAICARPAKNNALSRVEPALRSWIYNNTHAAEALQTVDKLRLQAIEATLMELDLTNPQIARIIYGAYLGLGELPPDQEDNDAMSTLLAAILALRDA